MSHFSVLVITDKKPTQDMLEKIMAPYHEYECTGTNDEYVQSIDITEDAKQNYDETETEESAAEWISEYYGLPVIHTKPADGAEKTEELKYGWVQEDEKGNVIKVINRTNPNAKWDWWVIGGRWSGFFIPTLEAKALGQNDENKPAKGDPGLMGSQIREAGADIIRKGDVDLETMLSTSYNKAVARWDKVHNVIKDKLSDYKTWETVRDEVFPDDIVKARAYYREQDAKRALNEAIKNDQELLWVEIDDYLISREDYGNAQAARSITTYAFIKDNEWVAKGEMGWFGMSNDSETQENWNVGFKEMLVSLPDDTWLTVIDCHI